MDISTYQPPLAATNSRVYRLVASIFPPVSIFDRIAEPADLEAVFAVEGLTNDRLRDELGEISLVPVEDRVVGPGTTPIMAAFTHLNPEGGRFNDHTFGVYYAALDLQTAVAETKHRREIFLAENHVPPTEIDMRAYVAQLQGDLHDVRTGSPPMIYHPDDYSASQALAVRLRAEGSDGIIYNSVRRSGGTCVAAFRPRLISNCLQERHLTYRWNGSEITEIYEKKSFDA